MKKADITLIIDIIAAKKELSTNTLSQITNITKRRLYDILPLLEATGYITRPQRSIIKYETPKLNNNYDSESIIIGSNGVITSVVQLSAQQIRIESTAPGFNVIAIDD